MLICARSGFCTQSNPELLSESAELDGESGRSGFGSIRPPSEMSSEQIGRALRRLAIFLDHLGSRSASSISFLVDRTYATLDEQNASRLEEAVMLLRDLYDNSRPPTEAWPELAGFLRILVDDLEQRSTNSASDD